VRLAHRLGAVVDSLKVGCGKGIFFLKPKTICVDEPVLTGDRRGTHVLLCKEDTSPGRDRDKASIASRRFVTIPVYCMTFEEESSGMATRGPAA